MTRKSKKGKWIFTCFDYYIWEMRGFPSLESQMMKEILSVREISCKSADKLIR